MNGKPTNVVNWPHPTIAPVTPEKVLAGVIEHGIEPLVVCGYDQDGKLYFASTHSEASEVLMLLRLAQRYLEDDVVAEKSA